jgi:predicted PhzF superfamily epimerase YddE/YHI9
MGPSSFKSAPQAWSRYKTATESSRSRLPPHNTAHEVLDPQPDLSHIPTAMVAAIGEYPEGSTHSFEMRTPGVGVTEDPVCGSMNASVGQWLIRSGVVSGGYRVSQVAKLGHAGDITISVDHDGGVWVGGATNTLFRGIAIL